MTSNIAQLENVIREFASNLLKTSEFKQNAFAAATEMQKSVMAHLNGSDLVQTGRLKQIIRQKNNIGVEINKTGSKAFIGAVDIDELNVETLRRGQRATFGNKTISLHGERDLPAWIIMEFGRRSGTGVSSSGIPKEFQVSYSGRDADKAFLFGPSSSRHFRKPVFFMTTMNNASEPAREHPGVQGRKFFQKGLADSKDRVNEKLGIALYASAVALAQRLGGEVLML